MNQQDQRESSIRVIHWRCVCVCVYLPYTIDNRARRTITSWEREHLIFFTFTSFHESGHKLINLIGISIYHTWCSASAHSNAKKKLCFLGIYLWIVWMLIDYEQKSIIICIDFKLRILPDNHIFCIAMIGIAQIFFPYVYEVSRRFYFRQLLRDINMIYSVWIYRAHTESKHIHFHSPAFMSLCVCVFEYLLFVLS